MYTLWWKRSFSYRSQPKESQHPLSTTSSSRFSFTLPCSRNIICRCPSLWRCLSDLISPPVHHQSKRAGTRHRSLVHSCPNCHTKQAAATLWDLNHEYSYWKRLSNCSYADWHWFLSLKMQLSLKCGPACQFLIHYCVRWPMERIFFQISLHKRQIPHLCLQELFLVLSSGPTEMRYNTGKKPKNSQTNIW